jgi:D123
MRMGELPMITQSASADLTAAARRRLADVRDTYIENWPDSLCHLSLDQVGFPLEYPDHIALLGALNMRDDGPEADLSEIDPALTGAIVVERLQRLEGHLATLLRGFPEGAFIRLGSRSPKDSWYGAKNGFRVTDARHGMTLLLDSMERMSDDLALAHRAIYQPYLYLRRWISIPPWAEFRCFMVNREFAGISQYDYLHGTRHASIVSNADGYEHAIRKFFPVFRDACHLDDVTFDIVFDKSEMPVLLEINPCVRLGLTDPCLFRDGSLDGSFRYIGDGRTYDFIKRRPTDDQIKGLVE